MRVLLAALLFVSAAADAAPVLDPLFNDNAVLQRGRPIHVTGTAEAGERVTVRLGPRSATARAGNDGAWRATLPAMPAGGPYALVATGAGGVETVASDVMVGDVWLCSGQSNMEFPMRRALNSDSDIGAASDTGIRLLTITQRTSLTPLDRFPVAPSWTPVTPQSVAEFSAACYFMARELRRARDVPLGLIDASWGGTRIRAWTSPDAIPADGDADLLALYRSDEAEAQRRFGEEWQQWWRGATNQQPGSEPWAVPERLQWRPFPNIGFWERWGDPALANYNGLLWARRTVTLTPAQASQSATLALGAIDEMDQTFVNGVPVGNTFGWDVLRSYRLPVGTLQAGANEILVAASDSYGNGGFVGPADLLKLVLADGTELPLGEGWRYAMPPPDLPAPPRTPWDRAGGVSVIHNAMVAPLRDFGLRGVAWYQGESDVGIPGYGDRLAGLMAGWRRQFGNRELPFLIVGLANWGPHQTAPMASGWAELREQQRLAAARDANAALVVAMDLGDRLDIHPGNKQEVGRRLARAAEALAYGGKQPVGPEVARARRSGDAIVVSFSGVTGNLGTWSGPHALAFELCDDTQESCRFADATASGTTVRIADDGRPATRVRHAWADSPVTNLYDEAPLPVGPFEVPIAQ